MVEATKQNDENKKKTLIDYQVAHNQWRHHGECRMQQMAAVFGYKLVGKSCPCDACGIAKATHSRNSKTTNVKATRPGERLFVDTTGPFPDVAQKIWRSGRLQWEDVHDVRNEQESTCKIC